MKRESITSSSTIPNLAALVMGDNPRNLGGGSRSPVVNIIQFNYEKLNNLFEQVLQLALSIERVRERKRWFVLVINTGMNLFMRLVVI